VVAGRVAILNKPVECPNCGLMGWGVVDVSYDSDGSMNTVFGCRYCEFAIYSNGDDDQEQDDCVEDDF